VKILKLKIANGDTIEIKQLDEEHYACPVCRSFGYGQPWFEAEGDSFAGPSFDICPCCKVQYGLEDSVGDTSQTGALDKRWEELRIQWLNKMDWAAWALEQLKDNLGVETHEIERKEGRKPSA